MGASVELDLTGVAVDPASPVPAYHQLHEAMRRRIGSDGLAPGARLPTERELSRRFALSRSTVRRALDGLEREGLLSRRQGDGTYVAEARIEHEVSALRGFAAELARRGLRVGARVVSLRTVRPDADLCAILDVADGPDTVVELRRVRSLDDAPLSYETVWLPAARTAGLLDRDLDDRSLYAVLRELGVEPASGEERLSATVLDADVATLLEVEPGSPAFVVERLTRDADGRPIERVTTLLRADRFSIRTELSLHHPDAVTEVIAPGTPDT